MTDATLTIRPAAATDAEAIAALFTDEGYPAGPSDIVERLTRFSSEHSQVVVAEHEGLVLGSPSTPYRASSTTTGSCGSWPSWSTRVRGNAASAAASWPRRSGSQRSSVPPSSR